jgi:vacuolar-type H+-ATPase subunit H
MSEDIDTLIESMKAQFGEMREHYDQQLQTIESEFDRERVDILDRNRQEIDALFNEHKQVENNYLDKR